MLQRGEQRVELREVSAVVRFELVDLGDAASEGVLSIEGGTGIEKPFSCSRVTVF
jgi:hypothetical protein